MNLCIFALETNGNLMNQDYQPTRFQHIVDTIKMIIKKKYFSQYAVILSNKLSTVLLSPTSDKALIDQLDHVELTDEPSFPLKSLKQAIVLTKQYKHDSIHILSFVSSEKSPEDTPLSSQQLQTLRSFHVQFVLLGDILTLTSETRSRLRTLCKSQGRTWGVNEVDNKKYSYDRLLLKMSAGLAFLPHKKSPVHLPKMQCGQVISESKVGKTISCKIINYSFNSNSVKMIPVPIISKQKVLVNVRCGKCAIEENKCIPKSDIGNLILLELTPMLFKLYWKSESNAMESLTIFYGEAKSSTFITQGREFIVIECQRGEDKSWKSVFWCVNGAHDFSSVVEEVMGREISSEYINLMNTIRSENQATLARMEEKYLSLKKEKGASTKIDDKAESKADLKRIVNKKDTNKADLERIVGNDSDKKVDKYSKSDAKSKLERIVGVDPDKKETKDNHKE